MLDHTTVGLVPDNDDKASAEPDVAADSRSSSGGRGRINRERAVRLVGAAAVEMRDALAQATRGGDLSRKARRELYELVPPPTLAEGIRDGTLRAAKPKTGDASVLVKNVKDGTIVGKADLQRVKPTPAELIGPVAWEAMALATQQHYLAEISEKLDGIQHGVDEVLAQLNDDRVGSLNHWSEVAASAQAAARRDGRLSETRLAEVREGALRTNRGYREPRVGQWSLKRLLVAGLIRWS